MKRVVCWVGWAAYVALGLYLMARQAPNSARVSVALALLLTAIPWFQTCCKKRDKRAGRHTGAQGPVKWQRRS